MNITELEVKNRNKRFVKANKARKRVMIAKDVIARIKSGQFIPEKMTYINPVTIVDINNSLQKELDRGLQCYCCAFGGVFASMVSFVNNCSIDEVSRHAPLHLKNENFSDKVGITKVFELDQLELIEKCFEGFDEPGSTVRNYYELYNDPKVRMLAIMDNIIKNKGTFIPETSLLTNVGS